MDVFLGYLDEIPVLRAERLLDAAVAAHPSKEWFDALGATIAAADVDDEPDQMSAPTAFRFNRRPVTLVELTGELSAALGAGFGVN